MNKLFSILIVLVCVLSLNTIYSQTITFSGINSLTQETVNLDSIKIYDLSNSLSTVIPGNTAFDLNSLTSVNNSTANSNKFVVSSKQNILDERNGMINFGVGIAFRTLLNISISNNLGETFSSYSNYFDAGLHEFSFVPQQLAPGIYYIVISNGSQSKAIKIINLVSTSIGSNGITYLCSQSNSLSGLLILSLGDSYNFTGYASGYQPNHIDNQTPTGGETYEFNLLPKDNSPFNKHCIIPLMYQHISDNDGGKMNAGNVCVINFEPNDSLHLYIASDTDGVSVSGTYKIESSKVHMVISSTYFPLDVTFPIDTSLAQITMPFKVLSADNGTSTWKKVRMDPEDYMLYLYNAIALDETGQTNTEIETRITDWGNSVKDNDGNTNIETITGTGPVIKVIYKNKTISKLLLYTKSLPTDNKTLSTGAFASDPRTHLEVAAPKIDKFDPVEKTALLIGPWNSVKFPNWKTGKDGKPVCDYSKMQGTFGEYDKLDELDLLFRNNGYNTIVLKDSVADLLNMIKALLPGNGKSSSPGHVFISSHGDMEGCVSTGTFWYNDQPISNIKKAVDAKYPGLWMYGGGSEDDPYIFAFYKLNVGIKPGIVLRNLFVKPLFWKWLSEQGADFSTSFIHIGACDLDKNPDLKQYIKAKAIFLYNQEVPKDFSGAVERYFIELLARPSTSTEEVYYNMLRLIKTGQMIYKEDALLNGSMPTEADDMFYPHASGYDGTNIISYDEAGWCDTKNQTNINAGNLWYLLWASRWSQDVDKGWQALLDCWDACWSKGDPGGMANQGCNNMSPGAAPNADEVAYAGWLLKGLMTISPSGTLKVVPRFTLNDAK